MRDSSLPRFAARRSGRPTPAFRLSSPEFDAGVRLAGLRLRRPFGHDLHHTGAGGVAVALSAVLGVVWRRMRRHLLRILRIDENEGKYVEARFTRSTATRSITETA